jgi:hypothetical protein
MSFEIQNLEWLRKLSPTSFDDLRQLGSKLYQALHSAQSGVQNIEKQTNSDATANPSAPPPPTAVSVSAQNGIFHVSVQHNADFYRGIHYHAEYADNPNYTNPFPIDMGSSREWRGALGNLNTHWRIGASYGTSPPSEWLYHGSASSPTMVSGGGPDGPALPAQSQGSGTGQPGQAMQGPGTAAVRTSTGVPPVRSQRRGTP